ncbi:MAG TPA: DUF4405 domain-containing protein [Opitutaceae bacterium]|nr:DUF4405 domain-containing protein [Opitutaceae bacterium]
MKSTLLDKTWLSPFVGIAFLVIATTGVLLFFHVKSGPIMALHEWFGWLFIVAGLVHVLLNLRPLLAYLKRPRALVAIGVAVLVVALLWVGGAQHESEHHSRGYGAVPSSSSAMP